VFHNSVDCYGHLAHGISLAYNHVIILQNFAMTSAYTIHVTYFPARARCEPVLLLLADSGIRFEYEEIPVTKWGEMKKTGQVTPATFPYSGVPVLRVTDKTSEKPGEFVLGETPAILSYLEEILTPPGALVSLMYESTTPALKGRPNSCTKTSRFKRERARK
jgi:hypothetical protein